jgi:hypothetical protein
MKPSFSRWVLPTIVYLLSAGAIAEESAHGGHGEAHHHKNLVAGFIGITGEDRRERALTLGVDYTRWLTPTMGIGVGVERAFGDLDFTVVAVPLSFRFDRWKFFAGPGTEHSHGDTEFLIRAGAEYAFEQSGYEVAPKFMLDFIDGDVVIVGGVSVGFGF